MKSIRNLSLLLVLAFANGACQTTSLCEGRSLVKVTASEVNTLSLGTVRSINAENTKYERECGSRARNPLGK